MAPEYRERFREALDALWDAPPTPARVASSQLRSIYDWLSRLRGYDWLSRLRGGDRTNVTPIMLRAFCASIGRSAVAMVSPYGAWGSRKTKAPTTPSPTSLPIAKPQPVPAGWSFFAGCA